MNPGGVNSYRRPDFGVMALSSRQQRPGRKEYTSGPARVQIYGRQLADGSARWWIAVHSRHLDALDVAVARELATALTDAADEIEGLN